MTNPTGSIAGRLEAINYRPTGFDYMRIILAISVIFDHATLHKNIENAIWNSYGAPIGEMYKQLIVPMFFCLSGFLVAGSLERCKSLVTFVGLRVIRIFPALAVEVILSAMLLGPAFTTLSMHDYFSSPEFHKYFWNVIGHIHYYLPGVFEHNRITQVNGQLWTVPWELVCYVALAFLVIAGAYKNIKLFTYALFLGYLIELFQCFYITDAMQVATGQICLLCFLTGLWMYLYRDRIPYSKQLFILSIVVSCVLQFMPNGIRFLPFPIAYATIYLGLFNPRKNKIVHSGDYSYGVYLYGYAIQQAAAVVSPAFQTWYGNLLFSLPIVCCIAFLSWHCIESPILRNKGLLKKLEGWILGSAPVRHSQFLQFVLGVKGMNAGVVANTLKEPVV